MERFLLVENDAGYLKPDKSVLNEAEGNLSASSEGADIVYAVLQKAGVKNNNGRIYSKALLQREVEKYKKCVAEGTAIFEVNHPEATSINLLNVGARLMDFWWEGVTLMGKLKLILSPAYTNSGIVCVSGDQIANLMANGVKVGISSRGVGSLKKVNGENLVQDDYDLICWDIVNAPSSIDSWIAPKQEELQKYIHKEQVSRPAAPVSRFDALTEYLKNHK